MSSRQRHNRTGTEPAQQTPATTSRRARLAPQAPVAPIRKSRTLTVGLASIVSVLVLMGLLAAWSVGMTLILVFGDRMSQRLITQNSEMQDTYEQRLQAYRAEIARLTLEIEQSRFDQTSVEGRVVEMGRRQRQIDARLAALKRLSDLVGSAPGGGGPPTLTPAPAAPTPSRISSEVLDQAHKDGLIWRGDTRRDEGPVEATLQPAQLGAPPPIEQAPNQAPSEIDIFLARMDRSLVAAEQTETAILNGFSRSFDSSVERTRGAMTMIGLSPQAVLQWRGRNDAVLPNIVLPLSELQTPFGIQIGRVRQNFAVLYGFRPLVETLPVIRPTSTEVRYSSGFGYRTHPIYGSKKLHAGIDMAAPIGTPVRAAGSGTVVSAGWGGGYGNLVQVDHGNGLISRYAHLSHIDVSPNQPVARGEMIGLMGTTGASTGSHLHFETRILGNPVNPACFILAGDQISGSRSIPYTCEQPPVWTLKGNQEAEDDDS